MELSMAFLVCFLLLVHLRSSVVFGQRDFVNPAITDPAPCICDVRINRCDPNCCCDQDCTDGDLTVSPVCNGKRTSSTYSIADQPILSQWNCSNEVSAAQYDYFPFVCVQLGMNEIVGKFRSTRNVTFINSISDASNPRSTFLAEYPDLFLSPVVSSATTRYNARGAPVLLQSRSRLIAPGSLTGGSCQEDAPILFGVNRDITCSSASMTSNFCTSLVATVAVLRDGQSDSVVNFSPFYKSYTAPSVTSRTRGPEYYFEDPYAPSYNDIISTSGFVEDYCDGRHPVNRNQRYKFCGSGVSNNCPDGYQRYSCPIRDDMKYATIPTSFFSVRSTSTDDPINSAEIINAPNLTVTDCTLINVRRVFYRFSYSSTDNTITAVNVYLMLEVPLPTARVSTRITIEWNDVASNAASATTIPRGYLDGEALLFRRNGAVSDVSTLNPSFSGLCVDAQRQSLRYKKSISSSCLVQIQRQSIRQCHNVKLNMFLYLNAFYTPASHVLAFPNANATQIPLRDDTQESLDLDRIDVTRIKNRLNDTYISRTRPPITVNTIYDAGQTLSICFDVPSGVYVEFGFVRVPVSSTVSYERIVSVQFNYTFSDWKFDCAGATCDNTTTQRYPVTFESAFIDYTNLALYRSEATRSDITSADNYIQHLLWLISPEYKGEPKYRNYTIAMILVFIAISVVVMHVLLFGMMCPF